MPDEFKIKLDLDFTQFAPAADKYSKLLEEGGGKAGLFAGHAAELKKVTKELGAEFPLAGQAIRLLTNPIALGLSMAIGIFTKTKEAIDKMNESVGESSQWESLASAVGKAKEAFENGQISLNSYWRELDRIATAATTATERSEALSKVMAAQRAAQNDVESARKDLELARANTIADPVARARALYEIEEKYAALKKKHADDDARAQESEQVRKLANEKIAAQNLKDQLLAAREKTKALGDEASVRTKVSIEEKRLEQTIEERGKKQARIDEIEKGSRLFRMTATQEELVALKQQVGQLDALEMQQRKLVGRGQKAIPEKVDAIRSAGEQEAGIREQLKSAMQRIAELEKAIPQDRQIRGIEGAGRNQAETLRSQARKVTADNTIAGLIETQESSVRTIENQGAVIEALKKRLAQAEGQR